MLIYLSVTAKSSLSTAIFTSQGAGHKASQQSLQLVVRPHQQLSPEFLWSFFFWGGGGGRIFLAPHRIETLKNGFRGGLNFCSCLQNFATWHISRFEQIYSLYFEIYIKQPLQISWEITRSTWIFKHSQWMKTLCKFGKDFLHVFCFLWVHFKIGGLTPKPVPSKFRDLSLKTQVRNVLGPSVS